VDFDVAVGVCLAVAAECHAYLTQRRMRMARAHLNRATVRDDAYGQLETLYARQRNILIALIAFSTYNSIQFVASTWAPTGWLPGWLQILVRGAIVPGLFYLAGELIPLITEPGDVLAHASREMTFAAVRTVSRQWGKRLRRARRRNLDLAPIAVTLLHDAGDMPGASRIRLIAEGLTAAEEGRMPLPQLPQLTPGVPANADRAPDRALQLTGEQHDDRPPTGPGSPTAAPVRTGPGAEPAHVLQLRPATRARTTRRTAARASSGGTNTPGVRTRRSAAKESVEAQARAVWKPGMTVTQLQQKAGISRNAASTYRRQFIAEAQEPASAAAPFAQ
jgi:hypothetical protein